jgi:hypothetical protein
MRKAQAKAERTMNANEARAELRRKLNEAEEAVSTREKANEIATMKLQSYDTDVAALAPGETSYLALVVRMPEEVGNEANYRKDIQPKVELGIIVKAEQQK